jgi:hypothetical protein
MSSSDPYAMNEDGTAKDPVAFKEAIKADTAKMEALQNEPEVLKIVLGDDIHAFQDLIKSVYQVRSVFVACEAYCHKHQPTMADKRIVLYRLRRNARSV